jgi:hypothetical protein
MNTSKEKKGDFIMQNNKPDFPLKKEDLKNSSRTKEGLLKSTNLEKEPFDYAMPQEWLDKFVAEYGPKFDFNYQDVIYSTFYQYSTSVFGLPISFMTEVDNALRQAGFPGCKETLEKIYEKRSRRND